MLGRERFRAPFRRFVKLPDGLGTLMPMRSIPFKAVSYTHLDVYKRQGVPPAVTHPLLASWGKQGRDYLHLLDGFDAPELYRAHWSRVDVFVDPAPAPAPEPGQPAASQLAQLQSGILNLNPPDAQPQMQADDGSIRFVTAHSAQRELEVLHDLSLIHI